MIASLRLTALTLGVSLYLCVGLVMGAIFTVLSYYYPFALSFDNSYTFVCDQILRTLVIALGGYIVAKKAAPVALFNVIVYGSVIVTSVFIVSLFSENSFYLERVLSAMSAVLGSYLGYSFFKDSQNDKVIGNSTGEAHE